MEIYESDICSDQVRQHDLDRYLCAMFSPVSTRPALMSLYAFNTELSLIRERVNEPLLGEIRLQWWSEQINRIYSNDNRPEGIAGSLYDFIRNFTPQRSCFETLIDGRTRDLSDDLFTDMDDFLSYCTDTTAPLIQLSILPFSASSPDDKANNNTVSNELVRYAAIASAATGLIRAIPSHFVQGRCSIPQSLLTHHKTTPELIFSEQAKPALKKIVKVIVETAEEYLNTARTQLSAIEPTLFPAFLPLVLAGFYLSNIRKSDFDPFHPRVTHPNNANRAIRLFIASWLKRY